MQYKTHFYYRLFEGHPLPWVLGKQYPFPILTPLVTIATGKHARLCLLYVHGGKNWSMDLPKEHYNNSIINVFSYFVHIKYRLTHHCVTRG